MALEDVYRKIGFLANTAGGGARAENAIAVAAVPAAPAAVLWDMDGTLVDSEEEWARVSGNVVRAHGGIWTDEDIVAIRGADTIAHGRRMMDAGPIGHLVLVLSGLFGLLAGSNRVRTRFDSS
ncbi:hypothetical protein PWJ83_02030, partial [Actinotignum sanguinis]|nr:hypothetical protein [Actinotignum sanguinis]